MSTNGTQEKNRTKQTISSLIDRLIPYNIRSAGPDAVRRGRVVVTFWLAITLWAPVFSVIFYVLSGTPGAIAIIAAGVLATGIPLALWRTRSFVLAGNYATLDLFWLLTFLACMTGGHGSPALVWMATIPMMAMCMAGRISGLIWTSIALLTVTAFYVLDVSGYQLPVSMTADHVRFLVFTSLSALLLVVWSLTWLYESSRRWAMDLVIEREKALRESETQKQAILDGIATNIAFVNEDLEILWVNRTAAESVRKTPEEMIGRKCHAFWANSDKPCEGCPTVTAFQTGTSHHAIMTTPDGRVWDESSEPVFDADGRLVGVVEIANDITQQKRVEGERETLIELLIESNNALEELNNRLEHSNRELQEFASVASHDLQEPLRKVQTFADRLKDRLGEVLDDKGQDYLSRMLNATARMKELINGLLMYSQVTSKAQPFQPVDLTAVTRDVLSDLEVRIEQVGGRIELGDLPTIDADVLQMRQLMQNLIGNALKFHRDGVPPVVEIGANVLTEQRDDGGEDTLCRITVRDNGIGFDEKHNEEVFGIFQRLHGRDRYEGTGMGLPICRKIVQRHNGQITASSVPGQGTTFTVILPVRQDDGGIDDERQSQTNFDSHGRGRRILCV